MRVEVRTDGVSHLIHYALVALAVDKSADKRPLCSQCVHGVDRSSIDVSDEKVSTADSGNVLSTLTLYALAILLFHALG